MKNIFKVLSIGEIKKSKNTDGNYTFEMIIKYPNSFKTNLNIFEFGLKKIKDKRKEYLKEVLK